MASFGSRIGSRIVSVLPRSTLRSWRGHAPEVALYLGLYLLYRFTRGLVFAGEEPALANAERVIVLEQSLGLFHEPAWQQWAIANVKPLVVLLNWVYIITYWPVILAVALLLYRARRRAYRYYRNLIVAHLALALAIFLLFPLAPPFKTVHMVDTIRLFGPDFYGSEAMAVYYNTNAAMPSLHFSWTCILGALFLRELKGWFRPLALAYPLLTLGAIIITGNHFILDALVGAALIGPAYGVAEVLRRRREPGSGTALPH